MAATAILTHEWVRLTEERVAVIGDSVEGEFLVVPLSDGPIGQAVGCSVCGEPLIESSVWTQCSGIPE